MVEVVRCAGVCRGFGDVAAVREVDLHLDEGEVLALVGLNGAGKTTLMRLLLGMVRLDAGEVELLGVPMGRCVEWSAVGHLVQTPFAYPELTVRENLTVAAMLHGIPSAAVGSSVAEAVRRLGLQSDEQRRCGTLSLGNRQRLGLAGALVHRPRLLVLDEPTNALDPSGVVLLRQLVTEAANAGAAIVVSSHHLDEVARVADRIAVMHDGRIVGHLDPRGTELEKAFFAMVHQADEASPGARAT